MVLLVAPGPQDRLVGFHLRTSIPAVAVKQRLGVNKPQAYAQLLLPGEVAKTARNRDTCGKESCARATSQPLTPTLSRWERETQAATAARTAAH